MHKHLTPPARTFVTCAVATAVVLAGAAGLSAATSTAWSEAGSTYIDANAPNHVHLFSRQAGVANANDDTLDLHAPDGGLHRASGYKRIDLTAYGVPADAKSARLTFKAVFTKGTSNGTVSVYAFARRPGASCCEPPVDHNDIDGMVVQTVGALAGDGDRTWSPNYDVALDGGAFEFSWGYRKVAGDYPIGDAVGIAVYLNGWTR